MSSRMTRTRGIIQTPTSVAKVTCSPQSFLPPFFFLFSSHATVWDGQGSLPPGVLPLITDEWSFSTVHPAAHLSVQRQYSCDAFTVFMHFLTTQQAQSKGMRSNLEGSQPQLQAHACDKPNAPITVAYTGTPFFT